ncbi:extracellular solute-binding protein [Chloroflexi bacterium TSY]|nr:extracellular solute-binding protein [Chloroflexi bacterium TSY]
MQDPKKLNKNSTGMGLSRRDMLRLMSATGMSLAAAACVQAPGSQPAASSGAEALVDDWTTGLVDPSISGTFRIISWEGEGEIDKFIPFIEGFFADRYPNMTVEIESGVPWGEYWTKLPTQIAGGDPPDLAWQHQSRGTVYPDKGWAVSMQSFIDAHPPAGWPDDWEPFMIEMSSYKGEVYALPYGWVTWGIFVNRDILEPVAEYPVDDNWGWTDLKELAIELTSGEGTDKIFGLNMPIFEKTVWAISMSNGADIFNADRTAGNFEDPIVLEAAQFLWDLRWKDGSMPTPADIDAMGFGGEFAFASGRVAMHMGISDIAFRLNEAIGDKFTWGVAPIPTGPEGRFGYEGGAMWMIPSGSKYPELASVDPNFRF